MATPKRPPSRRSAAGPLTSRSSPSLHATSVPGIRSRSAEGSAASSSSMRLRRLRNSKRRKISRSRERSGGASTSWAGSQSMSRRRRIVARSFESRACSACSRMFFARAGESSSTCSITASSEPYCATSCPAVLSPIPGTPSMLSEESPLSPMKSGICSGRIP